MMRLMGAVLVAFGAAWLGLTAAEELGRKVRRLEQLSIGLELLERELWERGSPLPQVLEELSLRTGEPASTPVCPVRRRLRPAGLGTLPRRLAAAGDRAGGARPGGPGRPAPPGGRAISE